MGFKLCTLFQFRVQIYNFFCKYANIFATIWKFGAFSFENLDKSPTKVRCDFGYQIGCKGTTCFISLYLLNFKIAMVIIVC